jgi:hypothetical protein
MGAMKVMKFAGLLVAALWLPLTLLGAQSTIDTNNKWAYSSSAGWINCRTDATNGAVIGQYFCSGYFYSSATGWINIGDGTPTNNIRYTNVGTGDYGVNHNGAGTLSGWAWSPSIGWVNFEHAYTSTWVKINLTTGKFSGYAYNSSVGWISFDNLQGYLETDKILAGSDGDTDEIPDNWEREQVGSTGLLSRNGDKDSDGVTDFNEYIAGTHPNNNTDYLHFTVPGFSTDYKKIKLTWTSEANRQYKVECNTNKLLNANWYVVATVTPASNGTNTYECSMSSYDKSYYRVRPILPLAP